MLEWKFRLVILLAVAGSVAAALGNLGGTAAQLRLVSAGTNLVGEESVAGDTSARLPTRQSLS